MDFIRIRYADYKAFLTARGMVAQYVDDGQVIHLKAADDFFKVEAFIDKASEAADLSDFQTNLQPKANVPLSAKTPDNRAITASNRIPLGYTVYPTGKGDDISAGTYNTGTSLICTKAAPTVEFQMLNHWYGLGGRLMWEGGATLADRIDAWLIAPATTGFTQATGDFNRVAIPNTGDTLHLYVPAAPGTGAWSATLSAKIGSSQVLQATPVPVAGNTGYFDYNSDTNVLTPNYTGTGGYNLYNFEIKLFKFANAIWGKGGESSLESTDVVGKLLFNSWRIRFTVTTDSDTVKAGIVITTATKKNL